MAGRLDGKVALITGGTSGIGLATVELFAAEGAKVLIVGRNEEKGTELAERLGPSTRFFRADVMHEEEIAASVAAAQGTFGRLDILFNNAGGTTEGWRRTSHRTISHTPPISCWAVFFMG